MPPLIVLCGGSGSGKSSLARALQERLLPQVWLHFSIDTLLDGHPASVLDAANQRNDWTRVDATALRRAAHGCVAALLAQRYRVIFDCVVLTGRAARDLVQAFDAFDPVWVGLSCDWPETERRTRARGDRTIVEAEHGHRHALEHLDFDHRIDTTSLAPALLADDLARRLQAGAARHAGPANRARHLGGGAAPRPACDHLRGERVRPAAHATDPGPDMQHTPITGSTAAAGAALGTRIGLHLDQVWRDLVVGADATATPEFYRLASGEPHPMGNVAIVRDGGRPAVTLEAVAPLLDAQRPSAVIYSAGVTDAAAQALVERGYAPMPAMPAMAIDIAALAPTTLPDGYVLARVGAGRDGSDWADVVATGFGLPRGLARRLAPEVLGADPAPDARTQFFAIRHGDRLVASSQLHLADGLAGVYCVATLSGHRGRGLGAHVTAAALRAAQALGYRVGVLQSSAAGHAVYLGLGFRDHGAVPYFVRRPG